jgi:hypothetical protein
LDGKTPAWSGVFVGLPLYSGYIANYSHLLYALKRSSKAFSGDKEEGMCSQKRRFLSAR